MKRKKISIIVMSMVFALFVTFVVISSSSIYWKEADTFIVIPNKNNTRVKAFVPSVYNYSQKANDFAYEELKISIDFYDENGYVNYDEPIECHIIRYGFQSVEYQLRDSFNDIEWLVYAKYGLLGSNITIDKQNEVIYQTNELKDLNDWLKTENVNMTINTSEQMLSSLSESKQEYKTNEPNNIKCVCSSIETCNKELVVAPRIIEDWDYTIIISFNNEEKVILVSDNLININGSTYKTSGHIERGIELVISKLLSQ